MESHLKTQNAPQETKQAGPWIRTAYLGYLTIGMISTLFGPLLASVQQALGLTHTQAGLLVTTQFAGSMAGNLAGGAASDRLGKERILAAAAVLVVAGALGAAAFQEYGLLLGTFAVLGLGSGGINGTANALVSDLAGDRRAAALNRLNINFSLGALLGPFMVARLFAVGLPGSGARAAAYGVLAGLGLLFGLGCLHQRLRQGGSSPAPSSQAAARAGAGLAGLARDRALWLMGAVLFTYVAMEASVATWWPAYLQENLGASGRTAGDMVTAFFVGVVVGRWLTSRLVERWGSLRTLQLEAGLAALAFPVAVLGPSLLVAASVVVTGLVAAGIWATTLALAAERHPGQSGTVSGLLIAVGSLGSSLFPLWIGFTGDRWGLQAGFLTLEGLLLVLVGITLILGRELHRRPVGRRDR